MERNLRDIFEDPHLREDYCQQESLDEFIDRVRATLESADDLSPGLIKMLNTIHNSPPDDVAASLKPIWLKQIDGATNMTEILYLSGFTTPLARQAALEQQFTRIQQAAREQGFIEPPDDGLDEVGEE